MAHVGPKDHGEHTTTERVFGDACSFSAMLGIENTRHTTMLGCPSLIWSYTSNHITVSSKNDVRGQNNSSGWHQKSVSVSTHIINN
jgi:hypothetical protein